MKDSALRQTPQGLQFLFDTYFADAPRDFIELLIWARDNKHDYQSLCSAVSIARMNGVHTITKDIIKSVLTENRTAEGILELPWTKSIEDGSAKNLASLNRMFNTTTDTVS